MNEKRFSITAAFKNGSIRMKNPRSQRAANCLQWRQQYQGCEKYFLKLEDGREIDMQQIDNGELKGIGTGAVVWPAAHVLAKYMEKRFDSANSLKGKRVIDIGSGTGCTGLIAAILGGIVTLTDQDSVRALLETNIEKCREQFQLDASSMAYREYEWEQPADHLAPPFDLVLVSDCVLPKLYPIEPLIKAVAAVMSESSTALFSYEHRVYPSFDPRHEFRRLAALHGLEVRSIPLQEHHDYYCADDIELWEVRRTQSHRQQAAVGGLDKQSSSSLTMLSWGDQLQYVEAEYCLPGGRDGDGRGVLSVRQDVRDGRIGSTLWASSVVMSRYLLAHPSPASLPLSPPPPPAPPTSPHPRPLAVDIGAGCGLTSMALRLSGYDVVATDKPFVLDVLRENVHAVDAVMDNVGRVDVREFDWALALHMTSVQMREALGCVEDRPPRVIVLSDCFYQGDAVQPVLHVINSISSPETVVVVANEMRSALDEFIRAARKNCCLAVKRDDDDDGASDDTDVALAPAVVPYDYVWDLQEISLSDENLAIYAGPGSHLAQRPTRLFVSRQTPRHL